MLEAGHTVECHHALAFNQPSLSWLPGGCRYYPELTNASLILHPWREIGRLVSRKLLPSRLRPWASRYFSTQAVNRELDLGVARRLTQRPAPAFVYGYFDTSLATFRQARRLGIPTVYELPTPYWKAPQHLCEEQRLLRPKWADTLPSVAAFERAASRRDEELQLADLVIVPSEFVRSSLDDAPPFKAPVLVVPYGCPAPTEERVKLNPEPGTQNSELLNLLFAGTLSQSKGLGDLLAAIPPLGNKIHLSIAGSPSSVDLPEPLNAAIDSPNSQITFLGHLPHADLLEQMHKHDVLVLPTLYEGLALVLLEAMSHGMTFITTPHSGLPFSEMDGHQGLFVPINDPVSITHHLHSLIADPKRLHRLQDASLSWSISHSWTEYRHRLSYTLPRFLEWR